MKQEKVEVFGVWAFSELHPEMDEQTLKYHLFPILPISFYPFTIDIAIDTLCEDYDIGSMGTITLVEDVFSL